MKKFKVIIILFIVLLVVILSGLFYYNNNLKSVSKENIPVTFTVDDNKTYLTLSTDLKKAGLIKSELIYKIYVKLNKPTNLQKGVYVLNKNMSLEKIIKILSMGSTYSDNVRITFKEGINIRKFIKLITENTSINENEILSKLNDNTYLDSIISKYWFLNADIKNKNIYYSLEGYLYPDTYEFKKSSSVDEIIEIMLNNTEKKLNLYKDKLNNNKYTIHQIITLASIVELESVGSDQKGVASVFYNRLKNNISLGSDVTTYYGIKVDINERDLYKKEIDTYNSYNTRHPKMAGKLPVGPICNPSIKSIEAVLNPTVSDYYYFVADKNKKTYFSKTYNEHLNTIARLKNQGLWYTYQN